MGYYFLFLKSFNSCTYICIYMYTFTTAIISLWMTQKDIKSSLHCSNRCLSDTWHNLGGANSDPLQEQCGSIRGLQFFGPHSSYLSKYNFSRTALICSTILHVTLHIINPYKFNKQWPYYCLVVILSRNFLHQAH